MENKMMKKVACLALCLAMLTALVGCGEQDSNKLTTEQLSTAERITSDIIPEPNQPIDPMVNITTEQQTETETEATEIVTEEPTTQPQKQDGIKYTIYGNIDIYLPIDIEDYMITNSGGMKTFKVGRLAEEYGWEQLSPGYLQYKTASCNIMFEYPTAQGDYGSNPEFPEVSPVDEITYSFRDPASGIVDQDHASDNTNRIPLYKNIVIYSGNMPTVDNFCATLAPSSPISGASKDLIVVIAYILTSPCREKAENPFVGGGELFEKYRRPQNETNASQLYVLP